MKRRYGRRLAALAVAALGLAAGRAGAQGSAIFNTGNGVPYVPLNSIGMRAGEGAWSGMITRVRNGEFTIAITGQASSTVKLTKTDAERTFRWDATTTFRDMNQPYKWENPNAANSPWRPAPGTVPPVAPAAPAAPPQPVVDGTMLRVGVGVSVIAPEAVATAAQNGTDAPQVNSLARTIAIRLSDLKPVEPQPVAPAIGPEVKPVAEVFRNDYGTSRSVAWSPDGATIAIGISDWYKGRGPAHLWDSATMIPRIGLNTQEGGNEILQFSPNGKLLAGVSNDSHEHGAGMIWHGETGSRITTLPGFGGHGLAWSPDSKLLALLMNSTVGIIQMYESYSATSGPMVAVYAAGKGAPPRSISLRVADTADRTEQMRTGSIAAMGWDKEGYLWTVSLAGYDRSKAITRWRITPYVGADKPVTEVAASAPLPLRVLPNAGDEGAPLMEPVNILGFTPDASLLVGVVLGLREGIGRNVDYTDCQLRAWDTATGNVKIRIPGASFDTKICAFSPQSDAVAVGLENGTVQVYDLREGKLRYSFAAHKFGIRGLTWSPDGKTLATGAIIPAQIKPEDGPDGAIRFWDAANGSPRLAVYPLSQMSNNVSSYPPRATSPAPNWLVMAPDGRVDASVGAGQWLRWRVGDKLWPWESYIEPLRRPDLAAKLLYNAPK